jgi:hypothetical protein
VFYVHNFEECPGLLCLSRESVEFVGDQQFNLDYHDILSVKKLKIFDADSMESPDEAFR